MDKYALYVWAAYGVTAVIMLGLFVKRLWEVKKAEKKLKNLQSEQS